METQLNEQEDEANAAIGVWQQTYSDLEKKNAELEKEIESSTAENKKITQEEVPALQRKLEEVESALSAAIEISSDADATATDLQERLTALESTNEDLSKKLQEYCVRADR